MASYQFGHNEVDEKNIPMLLGGYFLETVRLFGFGYPENFRAMLWTSV